MRSLQPNSNIQLFFLFRRRAICWNSNRHRGWREREETKSVDRFFFIGIKLSRVAIHGDSDCVDDFIYCLPQTYPPTSLFFARMQFCMPSSQCIHCITYTLRTGQHIFPEQIETVDDEKHKIVENVCTMRIPYLFA